MPSLCSSPRRILIVSLLAVSAVMPGLSQDDRPWLALRSRELLLGGRVLVLACAPLQEDLRSATILRKAKGAKLHFAYLSNGEALSTGPLRMYPNQLAADLRRRAFLVAQRLEADHTFLNMPHVDAAAGEEHVRREWPTDTLRARIRRVLLDVRPDLLLVNGLERPETPPAVASVVREDVAAVLKDLKAAGYVIPEVVAIAESWSTGGAATAQGPASIDGVPLVDLVSDVRAPYADLRSRTPEGIRVYSSMPGYPTRPSRSTADVSKFLSKRRPRSISAVDSVVRTVAQRISQWTEVPGGAGADRSLRLLIGALSRIDAWTDAHPRATGLDRRILLDWRWVLEATRLRILGVAPFVRISDSVLTDRQLTFVTIDSLKGLDPKGQTQVYFPKVKEGWILNERLGDRAAFVLGEPYRLISPQHVPLDLPRDLEGLERPAYRPPWHFFVVHWATIPERSFSLRLDAGFLGAPRFSVEVLPPIVLAANQQQVAVQLTNNSRDGVRDTVGVREELVTSTPVFFRLNAKGATELDTLTLTFSPDFPEGTHFVNVSIGGAPVARFLARKFEVRADSSTPVVVVAEDGQDATSTAVRRLGVSARNIRPELLDSIVLQGAKVILVSEYAADAMTPAGWRLIASFLQRGARLVVLTQSPGALASLPGEHSLKASMQAVYDTSTAIVVDRNDRLWSGPNDLRGETWNGWLFRRASYAVTTKFPGVKAVAQLGAGNNPAVLRWSVGPGTVHYVNLNLGHQFLNVLPAAYRLLANLLAY